MLIKSASANGAVTGSVLVSVNVTKVARISTSTNGHAYFDTTGTTLAYRGDTVHWLIGSDAEPRHDDARADERDGKGGDVGPRQS